MHKKPNYFFCYSNHLNRYLFAIKGFDFICEARNIKDNRIFWLYERTQELNEALSSYKEYQQSQLNNN